MRRDDGAFEESFVRFVRERGEHHLRVAALLTADLTHDRKERDWQVSLDPDGDALGASRIKYARLRTQNRVTHL